MTRTIGALALVAVLAIAAIAGALGPGISIERDDASLAVSVTTDTGIARADGINNRDSNIATCIAGFGFYMLSGYGLGCAHVFDLTHQFGAPITNGVNYNYYGGHQMWLNILWNMGLQAW